MTESTSYKLKFLGTVITQQNQLSKTVFLALGNLPPPQDSFCINIDGAASMKQQRSAVGFIISYHQGVLQVACRWLEPPPGQAVLSSRTELYAIWEALVWCMNVGFNRGEIVTDSNVVVKLVNSDSTYLGPECFLMEDIKSMIRS